MASTLIQFRADDAEKIEATRICEELGLNLQTYLKMCVSRLIKENGIPFTMHVSTRESAFQRALDSSAARAREYGLDKMTLDEINAEIAEARKNS